MSQAGWQKEQAAKKKQKEWESKTNESSDWMQKRDTMIKKKEEAELKAKEAEEKAPEFLKKLGSMKEKAQNKPKKNEDIGPTIEELDDGTDIPPWHRENAPEKPEWVVQLLLAAEREAQEEDEEEEHVFVAITPPKQKAIRQPPPQPKEPDQPEWMKQANNLKSFSSIPRDSSQAIKRNNRSLNTIESVASTLGEHTQQPIQNASWVPIEKHDKARATPAKSKSKSASEASGHEDSEKPEWMKSVAKLKNNKPGESLQKQEANPGQPSWMLQRSKIKQKAMDDESTRCISEMDSSNRIADSSIDSNGNGKKPAWMVQRSKIKQKAMDDESSSSVIDMESSTRRVEDEEDDSDIKMPAWMVQRSKIKQKAKDDESSRSIVDMDASVSSIPTMNEDEEKKPEWMKHKLKPRVSVHDLKSSKVQEKLDNRPELKKSILNVSAKDLTDNKVTEKLSQRPSLVGKKAPVKGEEMEWMKAKLKPRRDTTSTKDASQSDLDVSQKKETAAAKEGDNKPDWMKHKLKSRINPDDLKTNKVTEKLSQRPSLVGKIAPVKGEELKSNKVTEKLSQRPSLVGKKAPVKGEEMEWMKAKLKPRKEGRRFKDKPPEESKESQTRNEWMNKAKKLSERNLLAMADDPTETSTATKPSLESKGDNPRPVNEVNDDANGDNKITEPMGKVKNLQGATTSDSRNSENGKHPEDTGEKKELPLGLLREASKRSLHKDLPNEPEDTAIALDQPSAVTTAPMVAAEKSLTSTERLVVNEVSPSVMGVGDSTSRALEIPGDEKPQTSMLLDGLAQQVDTDENKSESASFGTALAKEAALSSSTEVSTQKQLTELETGGSTTSESAPLKELAQKGDFTVQLMSSEKPHLSTEPIETSTTNFQDVRNSNKKAEEDWVEEVVSDEEWIEEEVVEDPVVSQSPQVVPQSPHDTPVRAPKSSQSTSPAARNPKSPLSTSPALRAPKSPKPNPTAVRATKSPKPSSLAALVPRSPKPSSHTSVSTDWWVSNTSSAVQVRQAPRLEMPMPEAKLSSTGNLSATTTPKSSAPANAWWIPKSQRAKSSSDPAVDIKSKPSDAAANALRGKSISKKLTPSEAANMKDLSLAAKESQEKERKPRRSSSVSAADVFDLLKNKNAATRSGGKNVPGTVQEGFWKSLTSLEDLPVTGNDNSSSSEKIATNLSTKEAALEKKMPHPSSLFPVAGKDDKTRRSRSVSRSRSKSRLGKEKTEKHKDTTKEKERVTDKERGRDKEKKKKKKKEKKEGEEGKKKEKKEGEKKKRKKEKVVA